jgi:hypothetical protein
VNRQRSVPVSASNATTAGDSPESLWITSPSATTGDANTVPRSVVVVHSIPGWSAGPVVAGFIERFPASAPKVGHSSAGGGVESSVAGSDVSASVLSVGVRSPTASRQPTPNTLPQSARAVRRCI